MILPRPNSGPTPFGAVLKELQFPELCILLLPVCSETFGVVYLEYLFAPGVPGEIRLEVKFISLSVNPPPNKTPLIPHPQLG